MNRVTSSSNTQKKKLLQSHSQPPAKKEKKLKRERIPVNLLRGFSTRSSGSSSCSNVSGSVSSSSEASNSCHRSLLSQSFSSSSSTSSSLGTNRAVKSMAKTPKSAPVVSKPLIRKKPRFLEETKLKSKTNSTSQKRPIGKIVMKSDKTSILKKQASVPRELKLKDRRVDDSITPVSKLGTGSDLVYRSNGEARDDGRLSNSNSSYQDKTPVTPPIQASLSPEIQFGSSMKLSASAQSQACYAAGHLLSGVSDKRKCKPKGILTVGENGFEVGEGKILYDFDEFEEKESVMPLPTDASENWLLSPCDEEKEHEKEKYDDDGFSQFQQSVECVGHETLSPLSDRSTSSDLCNISSGRSLSPAKRRTSSSLSPNELSRFRRFMHLSSCEGVASAFDTTPACDLGPSRNKPSPLSVDTLGSENVIQTPESNSSFDKCFGHDLGSDLESLTMTFQSADLSPRSQASSQEPNSSSFNFDSLATSSVSVDLSQFQRALADRSSCHTRVTLVDTDTEIKPQQITDTEFDTQNHKESAVPPKTGSELLQCSAAESISTDGGGLVCSEDSNWMACYKNNFLDE